MRHLPRLSAVLLLCVSPALAWEHWGGDRGGTRFSSLARIMSANVGDLARAWEYRTGDLEARAPAVMARTKSETTPLLVICHQNVTGG
jgi:quinoprotein glucose dehydrogenase